MSKLYKKNLIYGFYFIVLLILSVYSYSLIDLNLTLFNHSLWNTFRSFIIQIGYFKRELSFGIYTFLIISLFFLQYFSIKNKLDPVRLAFLIGGVCLLSYPFLSHDYFNYMFDAKILTFYHKNPYLFKALDFPTDPWTRFMHWTHRTYPYGPTFLLITLVPSFLAMGKFILNYFLFKMMFVGFYLLAVYLLNRINKRWALFFAVNPLIIIEGLISPHNDLIGLSLAIVAIYFLWKEKGILARIFFVISGGIKYVTLPLTILSKKYKIFNLVALIGVVVGVGYASYTLEIQPWYFLSFFAFLPFFPDFFEKINLFLAGLLFSYYPYIYLGGWDKPYKMTIKHNIILIFLVLNLVCFLIEKLRLRFKIAH